MLRFINDDTVLKYIRETKQKEIESFDEEVITWLLQNKIIKEKGKRIDIKFYDIDLHDNKEKRIYSLEPKVFHGHILFNKDKVSTEFMNQLYDFPKAVHDDCPDALEMLWGLVQNKYKVGALSKTY